MAKPFPLRPKNPERVCWGCDRYCPADRMFCGNGTERAMHPCEIFGPDWSEENETTDLETPIAETNCRTNRT